MDPYNKKIKTKSEWIEMYTAMMKEINFMAEYICDVPEIFDTKTIKCKLFLVKIFTVLYPKFHYLSFLGENNIDEELVKIASILQIYPHDPLQKNVEYLQNINETKAHTFWIRFFNLCKIRSKYIVSNTAFKEDVKDKIFHSRFSSLAETLQHQNYNMTTINSTNVADINEEISTWTKEAPSVVANTESSVLKISPLEVKENNLPEIDNLISAVKYVKKKIDCQTHNSPGKNCYFNTDFFVEFNQTVKELSIFKKNLNFMSSLTVPNIINTKTLYSEINWLLYKNQVKRCNDILQNIIFKTKKCNTNTHNINF